jgi:hypothetical protein
LAECPGDKTIFTQSVGAEQGAAPMKTLAEDRLLSVEEIADYLGIKRDTVHKWIDRKKMPAPKV